VTDVVMHCTGNLGSVYSVLGYTAICRNTRRKFRAKWAKFVTSTVRCRLSLLTYNDVVLLALCLCATYVKLQNFLLGYVTFLLLTHWYSLTVMLATYANITPDGSPVSVGSQISNYC